MCATWCETGSETSRRVLLFSTAVFCVFAFSDLDGTFELVPTSERLAARSRTRARSPVRGLCRDGRDGRGAPAWGQHVDVFTSPDRNTPEADRARALGAIAALLDAGSVTFLDLLRGMESCLVTTDDARRARGVLLLAEAVAGYGARTGGRARASPRPPPSSSRSSSRPSWRTSPSSAPRSWDARRCGNARASSSSGESEAVVTHATATTMADRLFEAVHPEPGAGGPAEELRDARRALRHPAASSPAGPPLGSCSPAEQIESLVAACDGEKDPRNVLLVCELWKHAAAFCGGRRLSAERSSETPRITPSENHSRPSDAHRARVRRRRRGARTTSSPRTSPCLSVRRRGTPSRSRTSSSRRRSGTPCARRPCTRVARGQCRTSWNPSTRRSARAASPTRAPPPAACGAAFGRTTMRTAPQRRLVRAEGRPAAPACGRGPGRGGRRRVGPTPLFAARGRARARGGSRRPSRAARPRRRVPRATRRPRSPRVLLRARLGLGVLRGRGVRRSAEGRPPQRVAHERRGTTPRGLGRARRCRSRERRIASACASAGTPSSPPRVASSARSGLPGRRLPPRRCRKAGAADAAGVGGPERGDAAAAAEQLALVLATPAACGRARTVAARSARTACRVPRRWSSLTGGRLVRGFAAAATDREGRENPAGGDEKRRPPPPPRSTRTTPRRSASPACARRLSFPEGTGPPTRTPPRRATTPRRRGDRARRAAELGGSDLATPFVGLAHRR